MLSDRIGAKVRGSQDAPMMASLRASPDKSRPWALCPAL